MAKIDTSKIANYDSMSAEEKLAALEGYEYDDGSSEIDRYKKAVTKASSEAAEWKRKHNEKLTEDERKANEEAEERAKVLQELEEANARIKTLEGEKIEAKYKNAYLSMNYSDELASKAAKMLSSGDIDGALKIQAQYQLDRDKTIIAENTKNNFPDPPEGAGNGMTKSKFLSLSTEEQIDYKNSNPNWESDLK